MARNTPSTTTAFNKLPIELNKEIAELLEDDKDISNYASICTVTRNAIEGDNLSFWRVKWRQRFALLEDRTNRELRRIFKRRAKYLRRGMVLVWNRGRTPRELSVIGVLKELIVESWRSTAKPGKDGARECPNIQNLAKIALRSKLLVDGKRPPPAKDEEDATLNPNLAAVRLMCGHFLFEDSTGTRHHVLGIDESQKAVYTPTNRAPIFVGTRKNEVNMELILHYFNFFHYYMVNPDASALYNTVQDLDDADKPHAWSEPLRTGPYPLGKNWKGTYAYMLPPELKRIRDYAQGITPSRPEDAILTDLNVDDGNIQSIEFAFSTTITASWPAAAERRLHSQRQTLFEATPPPTHAQHSKTHTNNNATIASKSPAPSSHLIQITGFGEDAQDAFFMTGWLSPLPPQCGIPGWQRVTLMKHFQEELDMNDLENHWAYEGVVLPGGRMILGRWWYASEDVPDSEDEYSGPFVLWAAETSPLEGSAGEYDDGGEDGDTEE